MSQLVLLINLREDLAKVLVVVLIEVIVVVQTCNGARILDKLANYFNHQPGYMYCTCTSTKSTDSLSLLEEYPTLVDG